MEMSIKELLEWCYHGEGTWWVARLRVKQRIELRAEQLAREQARINSKQKRLEDEGWQGGETDPRFACDFLDPDLPGFAA